MLNLQDILNEVLLEAVSSDKVIDAIQNRYQVIINYSDDKVLQLTHDNVKTYFA